LSGYGTVLLETDVGAQSPVGSNKNLCHATSLVDRLQSAESRVTKGILPGAGRYLRQRTQTSGHIVCQFEKGGIGLDTQYLHRLGENLGGMSSDNGHQIGKGAPRTIILTEGVPTVGVHWQAMSDQGLGKTVGAQVIAIKGGLNHAGSQEQPENPSRQVRQQGVRLTSSYPVIDAGGRTMPASWLIPVTGDYV
jgi:hypothetical protein